MHDHEPVLTVVGLGKLGTCIAAVFSAAGFVVNGTDKSPDVLGAILTNKPNPEPGLNDLIRDHPFHVGDDTAALARESDIALIVVPTPSGVDGRFDPSMVCAAVREISRGFRERARAVYPVIVVVSTLMPGAMDTVVRDAIEAEGLTVGIDAGLIYSPSLIALGSVIENLRHPDVVLMGASDPAASLTASYLYRRMVAAGTPFHHLSLVDCEVAKLSINAYLSVKVGFANTVARVCEGLPGANVEQVLAAVGTDKRVGHAYLKAGGVAAGVCVPPETMVLTPNGPRRIDAMAIGDSVYGHDGIVHKIRDVMQRPYSGDLVKIIPLGSSGFPIYCTEDHPIYASRRYDGGSKLHQYVTRGAPRMSMPRSVVSDPEFVKAGELQQGDYVWIPRLEHVKLEPSKALESLGVREGVPLTPEMFRVFGFYLSEGYIEGTRVGFVLHQKETEYQQFLLDALQSALDVTGKINNRKNSLGCEVRFRSPILAHTLNAVFGQLSHRKSVPYEWLGLPDEYLVELLRGIWFGDGSRSGGRFTLGQTSYHLMSFVRMAMWKLGVPLSLRVQEPSTRNGVVRKAAYYLRTSDPTVFPRMNEILPDLAIQSDQPQRKNLRFETEGLVAPIRSVERIPYDGTVWNLEVDGSNSYLLEAAAVHNCLPRDVVAFGTVGGEAVTNLVRQADAEVLDWIASNVETAVAKADGKFLYDVAVLGLSYKPGLPVVGDSLGLRVLNRLRPLYDVCCHDPYTAVNIKRVTQEHSLMQVQDAAVIVVACAHELYADLSPQRGQVIVDVWRSCADEPGVIRPGERSVNLTGLSDNPEPRGERTESIEPAESEVRLADTGRGESVVIVGVERF